MVTSEDSLTDSGVFPKVCLQCSAEPDELQEVLRTGQSEIILI